MSDPWRLDGRVALVIGAGRGLGRASALELARAGARVVFVSRTAAELEEAVAEAGEGAVARVADATDEAQVAQVIDEAAALGELSVLVTAAGTNHPGPARDYPLDEWDRLFALNVRATFVACRAFGDRLLNGGRPGSIVTMSSQMGSVGYPGRVAYCATKHAVDGMTRALAVEWAREGIRVNAVAPTFVLTPLTQGYFEDPAFREEVLERRLPTGRLAELDDVARAGPLPRLRRVPERDRPHPPRRRRLDGTVIDVHAATGLPGAHREAILSGTAAALVAVVLRRGDAASVQAPAAVPAETSPVW